MKGRVEWTGENTMEGINSAGQRISMDWETGPSPMQLMLQMVGACSLVDVVGGLKDRPFKAAWVEMALGSAVAEVPVQARAVVMALVFGVKEVAAETAGLRYGVRMLSAQ